jgi:hypothetical protein
MRVEELLPKDIRKCLPKLGDTAEERDPMISVKFFFPDFSWTWYVIEFDGDDLFYGFVDGDFPEVGSFRLSELLETRGKLGCEIERDFGFTPKPLSEVRKLSNRGY